MDHAHTNASIKFKVSVASRPSTIMTTKHVGKQKNRNISLTKFASIALFIGLGVIFIYLSISEVNINYSANIFNIFNYHCFFNMPKLQIIKYIEGKTTQTWEKVPCKNLDFPQVTFCVKYQFKREALLDMGLPDDFLIGGNPKTSASLGNKSMPDLAQVWENGTYSQPEFDIRNISKAS